jgi:hypothetical protein
MGDDGHIWKFTQTKPVPTCGRLPGGFHAIGTGREINDQAFDKGKPFGKSNINLKR